jgi:D-3-phosphoglycerate dehydrogenase
VLSGRKRILLSEPLPVSSSKPALGILTALGEVRVASATSEEVLAKEIKEADALIVRLARITKPIIQNALKMRVIGKTGTGVDNIDVKSSTERGILVVNVPAVNTISVAEHAFSLILALCRRIKDADQSFRSNGWNERERLASQIIDLRGRILGIIGLGSIGREVVKRAKAFDMQVMAYDPYISPETAKEIGVKLSDLETLLTESDVVTIHAALSKETHHLIDYRRLGLMKKTAYLVNCARGPIVDEEALTRALREKSIAGAGCDVFDKEPTDQENPLLKLPQAIVSPHIAGFTRETMEKTLTILAEDVARVIKGEKPINLVNPEALATS